MSKQSKKHQNRRQNCYLGGENYRIGMGGAAVSSADTGLLVQELN
jgi:phosphoribosylformylglycinamidine (FGAM) synthase-like enzyme